MTIFEVVFSRCKAEALLNIRTGKRRAFWEIKTRIYRNICRIGVILTELIEVM